LSNLVATNQVGLGDLLVVDYSSEVGRLVFSKEAGGALVSEDDSSARVIEPVETQSSSNAVAAAHELEPAPAKGKNDRKV
jgi:hypothetical protein